VGWDKKPRLTFYVSARLWPHSDMRTWPALPRGQRILGVKAWGPSGTVVRLRAAMIRYGAQRARPNQGLGALELRGPEPKCKSINQSIIECAVCLSIFTYEFF